MSCDSRRNSRRHLSDPDLLRRLTSTDIIEDDSGDGAEERSAQRKPSLPVSSRQMQRAGVEIAGCKVNP